MRKQLIFIILIIIAPLLIAKFLLHFNYKGNTGQQGVLTAQTININQQTKLPIKNHKWHLLYIDDGEKNIDRANTITNINKIFNVHQTELNRLMITIITTPIIKKTIEKTQKKVFPIEIFALNKTQLKNLLQKLKAKNTIIALVDPRGYIPLTYPDEKWPIKFNSDLKKLMKLSQIG